jgi:hypothetical protein
MKIFRTNRRRGAASSGKRSDTPLASTILLRFWANRRLHGSYAETAFEEVIEANHRGTWTINAVVSMGRRNTKRKV